MACSVSQRWNLETKAYISAISLIITIDSVWKTMIDRAYGALSSKEVSPSCIHEESFRMSESRSVRTWCTELKGGLPELFTEIPTQ